MIRTNLYPPELAKRPVKRPGALIAKVVTVIAIVAAAGWWAFRMKVEAIRAESAQVQAREAALMKDLEAARAKAAQIAGRAERRAAIAGFAKKRLNWAPLLERALATIPENVEIKLLEGSFQGQEDCVLRINGRAAAERPRLECDKFRLLLADAFSDLKSPVEARLANLEDSEQQIRIANSTYPCADFSIELKWKNQPDDKQ